MGFVVFLLISSDRFKAAVALLCFFVHFVCAFDLLRLFCHYLFFISLLFFFFFFFFFFFCA